MNGFSFPLVLLGLVVGDGSLFRADQHTLPHPAQRSRNTNYLPVVEYNVKF